MPRRHPDDASPGASAIERRITKKKGSRYLPLVVLLASLFAALLGGGSSSNRLPRGNDFLWVDCNRRDAEVRLDGRLLGSTPLLILPFSGHSLVVLEVRKKGYLPWSKSLNALDFEKGGRLSVWLDEEPPPTPTPVPPTPTPTPTPVPPTPTPTPTPVPPTPTPTPTPVPPTPTPTPLPTPTPTPLPTPTPVPPTPTPEPSCGPGSLSELKRAVSSDTPDFDTMNAWFGCYREQEDWKAVVVVLEGMIRHFPAQVQGAIYVALAQAHYKIGGETHYRTCVEAAKKAERLGELSLCDGWLQQQLFVTCSSRYMSRTGAGRRGTSPELVNAFNRLRNEVEATDPSYDLRGRKERDCYDRTSEFVEEFARSVRE